MVDVQTFGNLAEAASAMSTNRGAHFLAGGTLVMRALNEGDQTITSIIRTTDLAFRQIESRGDRVTIGAGVTMSQILASRDLAFLHPVARVIGGPAIRNMATIGGNLFAPSPYGDLTAALLVVDAKVAIAGSYNREMPLADLLRDRDRVPRPLVISVTLERPRNPADFRFLKVTRVKPKGISLLSIATAAAGSRSTSVAYNGMSPAPMRALAVERVLEGKTLDAGTVNHALSVATEGTSPVDDAIASAWYRREVLPVHLRRLLLGESA